MDSKKRIAFVKSWYKELLLRERYIREGKTVDIESLGGLGQEEPVYASVTRRNVDKATEQLEKI